MPQQDISEITQALQQAAEQKLGHERAEALRADLQQMAQELHALAAYPVDYQDEP
jgi:hypothetical protein